MCVCVWGGGSIGPLINTNDSTICQPAAESSGRHSPLCGLFLEQKKAHTS